MTLGFKGNFTNLLPVVKHLFVFYIYLNISSAYSKKKKKTLQIPKLMKIGEVE